MRKFLIGIAYICIYTTPIQIGFIVWIIWIITSTDYTLLSLSTNQFLTENLLILKEFVFEYLWPLKPIYQFFWQFPHFWAIGWMMDEDYQKAGFKMLPSGKRDNASAFQIVFYTLWTIIISLIPVTSYSGSLILSIPAASLILILGFFFLFFSLKLMQKKDIVSAKRLMGFSIIYITSLQIIYVVDKFI